MRLTERSRAPAPNMARKEVVLMSNGTDSHRAARPRLATLAAGAALVAAVALGTAGGAAAQERQSGLQVTPDGDSVLISKDVNGERWTIVRDEDDDTVTGNVFPSDGGPPTFIWCERADDDDDDDIGDFLDDFIDDIIGDDDDFDFDFDDDGDDDRGDEILFSCFSAPPCVDAPCEAEEWQFVADVPLPASFFLP